MLNKLLTSIRTHDLLQPGDTLVCALSGGADSVALLFGMYLLKEKLGITLEAAHFNHHLRGEESDRDETFVREFCHRYDIPLHVGGREIVPGKKGLEAAARDARYEFLRSLEGKIATAHTADDNLETVLMHLVRGTGLKGLGGITPVSGRVIRPMLQVTRQEVEDFCTEWCLPYVTDSSNETDDFLRNRLRHHVVPLLKQENPSLAENVSAMALRLRQDEACLSELAMVETMDVSVLRKMSPALRSRALERFLKDCGIREPEASHIAQAEALVFSPKPSAHARFPGGVIIGRCYDRLEKQTQAHQEPEMALPCPGTLEWNGYRIFCSAETEGPGYVLHPQGQLIVRGRKSGDSIRLNGGTKSLKKLFIDKKIPARERESLPVIADEAGVAAVYSVGIHLDRLTGENPPVRIHIEIIQRLEET